MDLQLAGKTAVVTGGSKGIGLAVVRDLLAEGMRVVTGSRTITAELSETAAVPVTVDLTTPQGAAELATRALGELGGIDVLVNNVGIGDADTLADAAVKSLTELSDTDWQHVFDLHFYSALRVTRALLPSLVERHGVVVNVSSAGARLVSAGPAHYNVSKAALNALTKVIAEQYGGRGVRAVTVAPGGVSTGLWTDPDGFIGQVARRQGLAHEVLSARLQSALGASTGRLTTPAEVARLITFVASPSNITGAEYLIDGGVIKNL